MSGSGCSSARRHGVSPVVSLDRSSGSCLIQSDASTTAAGLDAAPGPPAAGAGSAEKAGGRGGAATDREEMKSCVTSVTEAVVWPASNDCRLSTVLVITALPIKPADNSHATA